MDRPSLSGINLADALRIARELGCEVVPVHRKGEIRISHPSRAKRVTVNCRKKNASRQLTTMLNQLVRTRMAVNRLKGEQS